MNKRKLIVDIEYKVTIIDEKKKKLDFSPFNSNNFLVSVGWSFLENDKVGPISYVFFNHSELTDKDDVTDNAQELQNALNNADIFIGHNAKSDAMWLMECGFTLPESIECTMVREYVLLRGLKSGLSLEECAITNGLTPKKTELIQEYLDKDITFDLIPRNLVDEYGRGDIQTCGELYLAQEKKYNLDINKGLIKTRDMSCEFTSVLVEIERNGIKIDKEELEKVGNEFSKEKADLEIKVKQLIAEVMGDTPINLNSPQQLSEVIYSRKPRDKDTWTKTFNLGLNAQGKPLYRPKMDKGTFKDTVTKLCKTAYRTKAEHCLVCSGNKIIQKIKKNGELWKNLTKCKNCGGLGFTLDYSSTVAGFKMMPTGVLDVSDGGFATDKDTLLLLASKARQTGNKKAQEFLEANVRISALDSYISSFVNGIKRGMQEDGRLHANFNQCITSTGRLSSTNPNLQNQPRGATFPIRGVFVSRWADIGGSLCETDFSQLEFRCAGHLARDKQVLDDIRNGKDIHNQTSNTLTEAGQTTNRQDAKSHTFKPLYGGMSGTDAEQTYYKFFLNFYKDIGNWHVDLQNEAIKYKKITLPTGREYAFPYVERNRWGNASQKTQIVNFPVQGFATADIVPIAIIYLLKEYKKHNLKSLLCLTVHDSVVTDVYPGEHKIVHEINRKLHKMAEEALVNYYGITMYIPLDSETKDGPNLLKMSKV